MGVKIPFVFQWCSWRFVVVFLTSLVCFSPNEGYSAPETLLKEGDLIRLEVFGQDSLTKSTVVDRSGYVTFPLIGRIKASGRSTLNLAKAVEALLEKDYIRDADVTIVVEEYSKAKTSYVTVLGEVKKPGTVAIPEGKSKIDLLTAIANAGGFSEIANPKRITVKRGKKGQKPKIFKLNASTMQKSSEPDFFLLNGDTVSVPKRLF